MRFFLLMLSTLLLLGNVSLLPAQQQPDLTVALWVDQDPVAAEALAVLPGLIWTPISSLEQQNAAAWASTWERSCFPWEEGECASRVVFSTLIGLTVGAGAALAYFAVVCLPGAAVGANRLCDGPIPIITTTVGGVVGLVAGLRSPECR